MNWEQFRDILPALALLAGLLLGYFAEWGHDTRTSKRERRKWVAEFQRDSLIRLQELLDERQISVEDLFAPRIDSWNRQPDGSRKWEPIQPFSKQMRQDAHIRRLTVAVSVRIKDETIRRKIDSFSATAGEIIAGPEADTADAMAEWKSVVNGQIGQFDELQRLIGERLRAEY